jgi:hypothetical protein
MMSKLDLVRPVRLAYQPPASSTFLSEQTSHHQPSNSTFLSHKSAPAIGHQPNEQAAIVHKFCHALIVIFRHK